MTRSKPAIASLGLLVALFGVMAFGTGVAQAEAGNHWQVNGSVVSGAGSHAVEVEKLENETASLLTLINNTKVKILCKSTKLNNVSLTSEGRLSEGSVTFHQCVTYLNDVLSPPCEPFSGGNKGLLVSEKGKGLLTLHEKEGKKELLTVITPVGSSLIFLQFGEECAIGEVVPVSGKLTLIDSEVSVEKATHLIKEGPLTALSALSNPVTIDGAAFVRLTSGLKFKGFML